MLAMTDMLKLAVHALLAKEKHVKFINASDVVGTISNVIYRSNELLVTSTSKWCMQARREHTNNHTYFTMRRNIKDKSSISCHQYCHSKECQQARAICMLVPYMDIPELVREMIKQAFSSPKKKPVDVRPRSVRDVARKAIQSMTAIGHSPCGI
jgi:hypothetical protein